MEKEFAQVRRAEIVRHKRIVVWSPEEWQHTYCENGRLRIPCYLDFCTYYHKDHDLPSHCRWGDCRYGRRCHFNHLPSKPEITDHEIRSAPYFSKYYKEYGDMDTSIDSAIEETAEQKKIATVGELNNLGEEPSVDLERYYSCKSKD